MSVIKLTSKRQATLPVETCADLGVAPGDQIQLDRLVLNGEPAWVLRPVRSKISWFGSLRKFAEGKSHSMDKIRSSVAKGRVKES